MQKTFLVTGGAGFIGSALVRYLINRTDHRIINVDKLTYAGNLASIDSVAENDNYVFEEQDICDAAEVKRIFNTYHPDGVFHLAAESHVDRSIDGPAAFINTNILGTYTLLDVARKYWDQLESEKKAEFRFLHVSTDEVFGALGETGLFTEETPYQPNSPYSASKASSDHLVRAWYHTYGFPTLITNCSNNYGPFQFPEKLIPVVILNGLEGKPIPVYGAGENVRDWLYVQDHVEALIRVLEQGKIGETYNVGGHNEIKNIDIVQTICSLLDKYIETPAVQNHASLITFVRDRPGHDFRYAIDATKIERELGWKPKETFDSGIEKTVRWYLDHINWCEAVTKGKYDRERLGLNVT